MLLQGGNVCTSVQCNVCCQLLELPPTLSVSCQEFFFSLPPLDTQNNLSLLTRQYSFCFMFTPYATVVPQEEAEPNLGCILCLPAELQSLIAGSCVSSFHLRNSPLGKAFLSCSSETCKHGAAVTSF